jgi:hypothetical protein
LAVAIKPAIHELLKQLPSQRTPKKELNQWWKDNRIKWASQLRTLMIEHYDIGHNWQFSQEQLKLLKQYYNANKFLVDCLKTGCNVSPEVQSRIEDNLLSPIDSSPI